ncbi:hypothetical protein predicted by Glimmer/Critica [Sorangium cellulosum So ce56]|uniref:Uncharacterized protein n=1 Tax=Sorangium cellulosum (strain So ce56) TaxID=448385 RepID=A9GC28_SORC5|nr:hypothetical protein [Sorangium cellulosum]CAN96128.1 hypothetical protein predicted by Glimmer/Critica [Sorangium cellulosum So ce56]
MLSMPNAATYVLPALGIGLAALAILGPGSPRMATGVRVWGAPVAGSEALALRVEGVRRLHGADDAAAIPQIEVSATSAGAPLERWTGSLDKDGIGEALLRAPAGLREPVTVRIALGSGTLLERQLPLLPPLAAADTSALPGAAHATALPGAAHGELRLQVTAARGALAAPFPERVRVAIEAQDGTPAAGARLEASAVGAELEGRGSGPAQITADARGAAELTLKPLAHAVELTLRATHPGSAPPGTRIASGTWEGKLPVIPGAIWLDPGGLDGERPELRLISPTPRPRAYVSIGGARGRALGTIVPLAADGAGFFSGRVTLPDSAAPGEANWAVVASDPYEQGAGTVAWPITSAAASASPRRVELLADGMPAAEARERARASHARRAGLVVLAASAVAQVLLLALRSRTARRRLEAHVAAASGGEGTGGTDGAPLSREDRDRLLAAVRAEPLLSAFALAALVGLSFAAVAALATFR